MKTTLFKSTVLGTALILLFIVSGCNSDTSISSDGSTSNTETQSNPPTLTCEQAQTALAQLNATLTACNTDTDCQYLALDNSGNFDLVPQTTSEQLLSGCGFLNPIAVNGATFTSQPQALQTAIANYTASCTGLVGVCGAVEEFNSLPPPVCLQGVCAQAQAIVIDPQ